MDANVLTTQRNTQTHRFLRTYLAVPTCLEEPLTTLQHKWRQGFKHIVTRLLRWGMATVHNYRDLRSMTCTAGNSRDKGLEDSLDSSKQYRAQETVASLYRGLLLVMQQKLGVIELVLQKIC